MNAFEDNQSCIALVKNPKYNKRTRHMNPKFYRARTYYQEGDISVPHIVSGQQIADAMTKPLDRIKFLDFRKKMGLE